MILISFLGLACTAGFIVCSYYMVHYLWLYHHFIDLHPNGGLYSVTPYELELPGRYHGWAVASVVMFVLLLGVIAVFQKKYRKR